MRKRGERIDRSFAYVYDTGGMRRTHLRHHDNILKRLLIHAGAFNLSLFLRRNLGAGTPRELKNRLAGVMAALIYATMRLLAVRRCFQRAGDRIGRPMLPKIQTETT